MRFSVSNHPAASPARAAFLVLMLLALLAGMLGAAKPVQAQSLPDFTELVERVGPAVVNIRTLERANNGATAGRPELDPNIEGFFRRHEETITTRQAEALSALMDLPDNDLLDLLLARCEPQGELDRPDVFSVLAMLRRPVAPSDER